MSSAEVLKHYLERLQQGEPLGSVQEDFARSFGTVSAEEIAVAEQELIHGGTSVMEVSRLCDLHSALFRGATRQERIRNAEKAVMEAEKKKKAACIPKEKSMNRMPSAESAGIPGHPLWILTKENEQLERRLDALQDALEEGADAAKICEKLQDLAEAGSHYDKKDELILPALSRCGVAAPADVMWTVDGELRKTNAALLEKMEEAAGTGTDPDPSVPADLEKYRKRAQEMCFKEEKVLFPLAEKYFTKKQWQGIALDMPRFGFAFIREEEIPAWQGETEEKREPLPSVLPGGRSKDEVRIALRGGTMSLKELEGILRAIPLELTFVDAEDINRYFSENGSLFPRAMTALDQPVRDCHPPKAGPVVEKVLESLRSGQKDVVSFVTNRRSRKVLVRYLAVRGRDGAYLGTLEAVEDISGI